MLKNISILELTVNDKRFNFTCETDSKFPEVREALNQMLLYVTNLEDLIAKQVKENEQPKVENDNQ